MTQPTNAAALEALQFLLDHDLHAEDEHDDDCPTCQAIRTIRAALSVAPAQGRPDKLREALETIAARKVSQHKGYLRCQLCGYTSPLTEERHASNCVRQIAIVALTAVPAEIVPANPSDPLVEFFHWAMENGPFEGCELDGGDVQEKAAALGLIEPAKDRTDWWVYTSAAKRRSPAACADLWSAEAHDKIIKRLMADVGMPNSTPLYSAFKQFANELHALASASSPSQPDTATKPEPRG